MADEIDLGIDGLSDYKEVGSGGFAIVYSALEADLDRRVAVKVLGAIDEPGRRRFDRERLTMGRTADHPNIVTPLRSGYTNPDNKPYLVMEYLAGGSLQDYVDATGPIEWAEAIDLILPVADALGFGHSSGVVHKDVKPANILISRTGVVKLSDFGIAAVREGTATSQVAFSMLFTAPETFDATHTSGAQHPVDPRDERSDLYSLAATLYMLGTGQPPFQGASPAGLMSQIISQPVPVMGHDLLDAFFATAMAKDPADRYPTAAQFITALRAIERDVSGANAQPTVALEDDRQPESPALASRGDVSVPLADLATRATVTTDDSLPIDNRTVSAANHGSLEPKPPPLTPKPQSGRRPTSSRPRRFLFVAAMLTVLGVAVPVTLTLTRSTADNGDVPETGSGTEALGDNATTTDLADSERAVENSGRAADASPPEAEATPSELTFSGHTGSVVSLVQLSDGRIASAGTDGTVQVWDPIDPAATIATYTGHAGQVNSAIELADGRVVSAGEALVGSGGAVRVWDPNDPGDDFLVLRDLSGWHSLALLPDGRVAAGGRSGTVWVFEVDSTGSELELSQQANVRGHVGRVVSLAVLEDGRLASASFDHTVRVWDPDNPSTDPVQFTGHSWHVHSVAATADGRVASASKDGTVQIWHPDSPDSRSVYTGHTDGVLTVISLTDGRLASGGADGTVQIWHPSDPDTTLATYTGHTDDVLALVELSDGRIASTSLDDTVQVWDPANL